MDTLPNQQSTATNKLPRLVKILLVIIFIVGILVISSYLTSLTLNNDDRSSEIELSQKLPEVLKNPAVIKNPGQIAVGQPYKLNQDGNPMLLAKVKRVIAHPKNLDEYQLFLDLDGNSPKIETIPFAIRPIYTGEKETPGRETFIYHSQVDSNGNQKQIKANVLSLEEGVTVFITYKINPWSEVFVISVGIQRFVF